MNIDTRAKISRPPILVSSLGGKGLEVFRVGEPDAEMFDILIGGKKLIDIKPWQYHLLNALFGFGGDSYLALIANVHDRFGTVITQQDIDDFFGRLTDYTLVDYAEAAKLPFVSQITDRGRAVADAIEEAKQKQTNATVVANKKEGIPLFKPTWLLIVARPFFFLGTLALIILPPIVVIASYVLYNNWGIAKLDFSYERRDIGFLWILLIGLLSVNLLAISVRACVVYLYCGTVSAVTLRFAFFVLPRFGLRIEDIEKFSRRQAIWVNAAPLLSRLGLAGAAILFWNANRDLGGSVSDIALTVAMMAFVSFVLMASPLFNGEGYKILVEYFDEPKLLGKAFKALFNRFNPAFHQTADSAVLAAYAMLSLLFMLCVVLLFAVVLWHRLNVEISSNATLVVVVFLGLLVWRIIVQLQQTNETYWKNFRFERWRERTLPSSEQAKIEKKNTFTFWRVIRMMMLTVLVIVLFQPYAYRPSGPIGLSPKDTRSMTTDMAGVIAKINFSGGDIIQKGNVIATLSTSDLELQLDIRSAELAKVTIPYEYALARCDRNETLFSAGALAQSEYEDTLEECLVAEAEIARIAAEIIRIENKIARSEFIMPFEGQITDLYFKERTGDYLKEGDVLTTVSDVSAFKVKLEIREADLALVTVGDPVDIRVNAYPDRTFIGKVEGIEIDVEEDTLGAFVKVVVSVQNEDHLLQSGMTGYAKTKGTEMKVWQILTLSIRRFITIDLWAWLP